MTSPKISLKAPCFNGMTAAEFIAKVRGYQYLYLEPSSLRNIMSDLVASVHELATYLNKTFPQHIFTYFDWDVQFLVLYLWKEKYEIISLKTVQPYFDLVFKGIKNFEVRKNDRNFQVGQFVLLREYNAQDDTYTGRMVMARIRYILDSADYVKDGYTILQLEQLRTFDLTGA